MSILHEACYFGDIVTVNEELSRSDVQVLALLQSPGLVFVPYPPQVRSGESFLRSGTPAHLAVQGGNFKCANIALAAQLCSHMQLAPYWQRSVSLEHNVNVTVDERLRILLQFFGRRHFWHLQTICSVPRSAPLDALYTLLGACILGDTKTVLALVRDPQRADRWRAIRRLLEEFFYDRHDTYCSVHHLAVCAAALSGDQSCLQALLNRSVGRVLPLTLNKAWICLLKFVWPWNLPQLLPCLRLMKASYKNFTLETNYRLFSSLVVNSSKWMELRSILERELRTLQKRIPPPMEFFDLLDSVIEYGFDMVAWNKKNVDVPKMTDAALAAAKFLRDDRETKSLERLLILILSHRDTVPVLGCLGCRGVLQRLRGELQVRLVKTVCQYMVVCQKWRVCLNKACLCPMCHPVINFLCGVDSTDPSLQIEDVLDMMCYYLSTADRSWLQSIIRNGIEPSTLCKKHSNVELVNYPMFFKLGDKEVPKVLQPVLETPIIPTLFQASLIAVLKSLNGHASRLYTLKMPSGLLKHFFLDDFLHMLK